MKVWVSKHPCSCRTPTPVIETPMVDHQHGVGGPPWVLHQVVWVYDSNMGASTPTLSYNSPPMDVCLLVTLTAFMEYVVQTYRVMINVDEVIPSISKTSDLKFNSH